MCTRADRKVRGSGVTVLFIVLGILPALCVLEFVSSGSACAVVADSSSLEQTMDRLQQAIPDRVDRFSDPAAAELALAVAAVDRAASNLAAQRIADVDAIFHRVSRLNAAKLTIDASLNRILNLRVAFAALDPAESRRQSIRNFLRVSSELINLTGRLEYELANVIGDAAYKFAGQPDLRDDFIDHLIALRSGIGASIMAWTLIDPAPRTLNRAVRASSATKVKVLAMIAWSGRADTLPVIAQFLMSGQATPELLITATETIRQIGLPQDPRAGRESNLPPPAITASQLRTMLEQVDHRSLNTDLALRRAELARWLDRRVKFGIESDEYQVGRVTIRPGDWLLMRNSSPYNLFTDLAPGLFTHVSVVTTERDSGGYRRMVVVEVTEKASRVPANNVESVLDVPLFYVLLRHDDPLAARQMSEVAASLINNELEYDMGFDTALVTELAGRPLANRKIKTYCAGLPLLCAQATSLPRHEFFPIAESPAGGLTVTNLKKLGVRFGTDFVSPTGAVFSRRMAVAARNDPIYTPARDVEQQIYDHFAQNLLDRELVPTRTLYQSLRVKLADASRTNPLLARALASAAGVHAETDLLTAAKTLAVVETLYEIATASSGQLLDALDAVFGGPIEQFAAMGRTPAEIERIMNCRTRHADLIQSMERQQQSARQVRDSLVQLYSQHGKSQIDRRFFGSEPGDK